VPGLKKEIMRGGLHVGVTLGVRDDDGQYNWMKEGALVIDQPSPESPVRALAHIYRF
jgi:hypothetical protein